METAACKAQAVNAGVFALAKATVLREAVQLKNVFVERTTEAICAGTLAITLLAKSSDP